MQITQNSRKSKVNSHVYKHKSNTKIQPLFHDIFIKCNVFVAKTGSMPAKIKLVFIKMNKLKENAKINIKKQSKYLQLLVLRKSLRQSIIE